MYKSNRLSVTVGADLAQWVKIEAIKRNISINEFLLGLIKAEHEKGGEK